MQGNLNPEDIVRLLAQGMGEELHWFPQGVSPERLATAMIGMANSRGGEILIGVSPRSGLIQGITDPGAGFDLVFQAALLSDPPLVLPLPRQVEIEELSLLVVVVPRGLPYVYNLDGRYFVRQGAQTNPIPARQLRQLLVERGVIQFEAQVPPGASLDDLDMNKVEAYIAALRLPGAETPEDILLRRGCLGSPSGRGGDTGLHPNYAGLLLFGKQPQRWLPGATILAARFTGSTFADRYLKQEINGTLIDQLYQVEGFFSQNIRNVVHVSGFIHQDEPEYPLEAVRELLVNAVAHRDYNQQGDSIHLNLFADRLEVHSPGGLPGPVTLDNLLQARFSRNPVIVQALADMGFVERLGYGLDRVVQAVRQAGLRPPQFAELAGSFRVTLFGASLSPAGSLPDLTAYHGLGLNARQEAALAYLSRFRRITSSDYQSLCPEVHPETLRRDLADMIGRGILIKVGDKRSTYYIIK